MNCKITQSKMLDYIDGALYRDECSDIEIHLCGCEHCREFYQEMKAFSDTCAEFVVYPDQPYSFKTLRARMATIRPLDEVVAFFPKMRARGLTGRLATATLLMLFVLLLPTTVRISRESCTATRRPFTEEKAKWEPEYQEELDAQYRQKMAAYYTPCCPPVRFRVKTDKPTWLIGFFHAGPFSSRYSILWDAG